MATIGDMKSILSAQTAGFEKSMGKVRRELQLMRSASDRAERTVGKLHREKSKPITAE
jgi:hypothetical protein